MISLKKMILLTLPFILSCLASCGKSPPVPPAKVNASYSSPYEMKDGDLEEFVRNELRDGMPYTYARSRIKADSLPRLYKMIDDKDCAKYWNNISRLIGYISEDPNSVQILLNYFQRDDGDIAYNINGKVWTLAFIGKIGGSLADEVLKSAITEQGAKQLAGSWIDKEQWPDKNWDKQEIVDYIRAAALLGLVYTRKPDNLILVDNTYKREYESFQIDPKNLKMLAYSIDAIGANDYIKEKGLDSYLNLRGSERIKSLWPYLKKYSPQPK